jgi:branched-chain amino acid transport system substrate-binding protein
MITSFKSQRNPYVIGRPIDQQLFFGRESLFSTIQGYIQRNSKIILLHGQRRIGKSSIIRNISYGLNDLHEFVFVTFNLEHYSQKSLSEILADLAQEIIHDLSLDNENIKLPEITELELDSGIFSHQFLPQVYQLLENKNLVLVVDEFDALMNSNNPELLEQVYKYLSSLTNIHKKLFLILLIEQRSVNKHRISKIFKDVPVREIGLLNEESTTNLIIKPAENILEYEEDAIKAIFDLSAGHPYFTQAICFTIFGRAREEDKWTVSSEDVKLIINKAIELAEAGLTWFWEGFSILERVVFAAIAEAQEDSDNYVRLIKRFRPDTEDKLIIGTNQLLRSNGFLDEIEERVKIEFVRLWIIQRHPLSEEIHELDKIEQKKNPSNSNIIPHSNTVESDFTLESDTNLHQSSEVNIPDIRAKSNLIILTAIASAVFIISSIIVASIARGSKCEPGERKQLGVFCVADNSIINGRISRGDRTFFPEINNIPRDKGIQAFQQGNYPEATTLFQQAVTANRYDPEVLIYYNNALARQKGSPLTLAVVVPVDKSTITTQEVLRGVAQAQNQFNQNKGLNSRLLEIVIANDSNTEKAKEVAQELIKDSSILGVIGHISSDATNMALREYEKAELAVISPTSTSILLNNPVFFRAVSSDESAGKKLAEYTYKSLKLKKAVIFGNPTNSYSNSIREIFTNQFEKLGGEVVRKPLIDLTSPTFDAEKEVAKSVYGDHAEAVMLFSNTKTDITLKIAKEITKRNETLKTQNSPRRELKMLGGDNLYQGEILNSGGKNVDGLIIAVPWFGETSQAQSFAKKAEKQWGGGISWRTATSFDATQALIKALSNNPSRSTVLEGLANVNLSANETSGYPLKFTPERERDGQSILLQIKQGQFTMIPNN